MLASFEPFRISGIYFASHLCIELPSGTSQETLTQVNDIIVLE